MEKKLQEIIDESTFSISEGSYVYLKLGSLPKADRKYLMVASDEDEITVVAKEGDVEGLDVIERNKDTYNVIALNVAVPFYSVGFLAAVSAAIAKEGINVLIVSTYSKDYLLIEEGSTESVRSLLVSLGLKNEKNASSYEN